MLYIVSSSVRSLKMNSGERSGRKLHVARKNWCRKEDYSALRAWPAAPHPSGVALRAINFAYGEVPLHGVSEPACCLSEVRISGDR
jgi:hypothetical protein